MAEVTGLSKYPMQPTSMYVFLSIKAKTPTTTTNVVVPIAAAAGVSLSYRRQKTPVFTLGMADAIGHARGVRAISGTLDSVVLDAGILMRIYYEIMRTNFASNEIQTLPHPIYDYYVSTGGGEGSILAQLLEYQDRGTALNQLVEWFKILAGADTASVNPNVKPNENYGKVNNIVQIGQMIPIMLDEITPCEMYIFGFAEYAEDLQGSDEEGVNDDRPVLIKVEGVEFEDTVWRIATNLTASTERVTFSAKQIHFSYADAIVG